MNVPAVANSTADRDVLFVRAYLENGGDEIAACQSAGILDRQYPVEATAKRQLSRPEIAFAIEVAQRHNKGPSKPPATREEAAARAQTLINKSLDTNDVKGAVVASRFQAELQGYLDKNISVTVHHDVSLLTNAKLEAIAAGAVIDAEFEEVGASEETAPTAEQVLG